MSPGEHVDFVGEGPDRAGAVYALKTIGRLQAGDVLVDGNAGGDFSVMCG